PDNYMSVLHLGEARVDVLLLLIRLGVGENPIEIGRVSLVLPVLLDRMEVGLGNLALWRVEHRRHSEISRLLLSRAVPRVLPPSASARIAGLLRDRGDRRGGPSTFYEAGRVCVGKRARSSPWPCSTLQARHRH